MASTVAADIYITQGFICRDAKGQITNLQRGGNVAQWLDCDVAT